MGTIMLDAGLKDYTLWLNLGDRESGEEVGENAAVYSV
jgi:hypothetical protein